MNSYSSKRSEPEEHTPMVPEEHPGFEEVILHSPDQNQNIQKKSPAYKPPKSNEIQLEEKPRPKPEKIHDTEEVFLEEKPIKQQDIIQEGISNKKKTNKLVDYSKGYEANDHLLSLIELSNKYGTDINISNISQSKGISKEKVPELQAHFGKNCLTPPKETPEIIKFLKHAINGLNILLIAASALCFAAYGINTEEKINLWLAIFLLGLVVFDMIFEYIQEASSNNVMKQFKKMLPPKCKVIRGGSNDEIPAIDLVPGDIVVVTGGERIPADLRVILNNGLKVEQSALNGESEPVEIVQSSTNPNAVECRNIIFNGCMCLEGSATGVVIKTGDNTFLGIVAKQVSFTVSGPTPLQKELTRFILIVAVLAVTVGLCVFIIGVGRVPDNALKYFVNGFIIILVANIPEGLPATVISCLTIVAKRMAKENVYIKKLETIETLGSATCIASDKTGTLTTNKMTVEHVWFDQQIFSIDYLRDQKQILKKNETWKYMVKISGLCNKAFYKRENKSQSEVDKTVKEKAGENNIELKIRNTNDPKENVRIKHEEMRNKFRSNSNVGSVIETIPGEKNKISENHKTMIENFKKVSGSFRKEAASVGKEKSFKKPSSFWSKTSFREEELLGQLKDVQAQEIKRKIDEKTKKQSLSIVGDASETALLRFCELFKDTDGLRIRFEKIFEVPFNSKVKYQLSVHEAFEKRFLLMKGAPEIIIERCDRYMKNGEVYKMSNEFKDDFQRAYQQLGMKGERLLGASFVDLGNDRTKYSQTEKNYPDDKLIFLGLFALMDPPKKGVKEAIEAAHNAGVKVHMVTGDHPITAEAIARKVGIITEKTNIEVASQKKCNSNEVLPEEAQAAVIYGPDLKKFTEGDWENLILYKTQIVFARITPQQKVEIVSYLQKYQEIVIVTGDGVNDAIALKKADLGVAMGAGGSDVAKEAADVIFIDDNFASIINGIKEGRILFDNLKKSISYTMTHIFPELIPIILNIIFEMPLGLGSLQILALDLGTELAPAISMAYEYGEEDVMERLPRNVNKDRLVTLPLIIYAYGTAGVIEIVWCLLAYFTVFWENNIAATELSGIGVENFQDGSSANPVWNSKFSSVVLDDSQQVYLLRLAQTAWFTTLVMSQFCHIWFARTRQVSIFKHGFNNSVTNFGVIIEIAILNLIVWTPGLQTFFSTVDLPGIYWTPFIGAGICLFIFNETRKWWTRKYPKGKAAKYLLW